MLQHSLPPSFLRGSCSPQQLLSAALDGCDFSQGGTQGHWQHPRKWNSLGKAEELAPKTNCEAGELPKCTPPSPPHPSSGSHRGSRHAVLEGWESLGSHMLPGVDSQLTSTCF